MFERLQVSLGERSYDITLGAGLLDRADELLPALVPLRRTIVVTDGNLAATAHPRRLGAALARAGISSRTVVLPPGEGTKSWRFLEQLVEEFLAFGVERRSVVTALGGGVIGDLVGFAAAATLRGIDFIQIPTTLLAQVDSAVGGKVGVNHTLGKNLIGAFHPPSAVVIDPSLLATLPRREFRAGLYEVVKYGVIASRPLFERTARDLTALFARDAAALLPVVSESCRIKAEIVEQDEHESGLRRTLNFGHTVGHALEAVTKYRRFRHGEAVAYGMLAAAAIGTARKVFPAADRDALAGHLMQMGPLPSLSDLPVTDIIAATRRDKKVIAGRLHFVLPTGIGSTTTVSDVTPDELKQALLTIGAKP
jgi:3-dehydroquinate synthase